MAARCFYGVTQCYLAILLVQNVSSALLIQMSRDNPYHNQYHPVSTTLATEIFKLMLSLIHAQVNGDSWSKMKSTLRSIPWKDSLKLAVPALIYAIENNLIFVSLSHIDSATFQVLSQCKILTTALFSVSLFGRRLHRIQWLALIILICGASLAHLGAVATTESKAAYGGRRSPARGVVATLLLALLSGFAGVYVEKVVKGTLVCSLPYVNMQLAGYSIAVILIALQNQPLASESALATDNSRGLLSGFTWLTWLIVFTQSIGGLFVSGEIRYSSSLARSYVVTGSIFITGLISQLALEAHFTIFFGIGAVVVACSVLLFNEPDQWHCDPYERDETNPELSYPAVTPLIGISSTLDARRRETIGSSDVASNV